MKALAEIIVAEIGSGFEQRGKSVAVGENGAGFHEGEEVEGKVVGWG